MDACENGSHAGAEWELAGAVVRREYHGQGPLTPAPAVFSYGNMEKLTSISSSPAAAPHLCGRAAINTSTFPDFVLCCVFFFLFPLDFSTREMCGCLSFSNGAKVFCSCGK